MRKQMGVGLRTWVLGAAATGLLSPSLPAVGQSEIFTNAKKPVSQQANEPPKLLAVSNETNATEEAVIPASQIEIAQSEKSEVQKQLEMLYEKDGREMPDLKLNLQPLSPVKTSAQGTPPVSPATVTRAGVAAPSIQKPGPATSGHTKYQPAVRPQATPYPAHSNSQLPKNYSAVLAAQSQPPAQSAAQPKPQSAAKPHQNRLTGFFKRFVPGRKASISTPPIPPDYPNSIPDISPSSTLAASTIPLKAPFSTMTPTVQMTTKPVLSPVPLQTTPLLLLPQAPIAVGFSPNAMELQQPILRLPELAQLPVPLTGDVDLVLMPPLLTEPDPRALIAAIESDASAIAIPSKDSIFDFPNPFPEIAESQADGKIKIKLERPQIPMDEPAPVSELLATDDTDGSTGKLKPSEDPFAVRVKDFSEPVIDEKLETNSVARVPERTRPSDIGAPNTLDVPEPKEASPAIDLMPPAPPMPEISGPSLDIGALKPAEEMEDTYLEKMRRIRERFGMKGLKGFCPVTLRDERELLDAKPEYFYTHRGQKFHFATADARNKFEADPSTYAPAAYGADVVALGRDKEVVEGTLDFAAWFKGRLYLFGSQANYDVFVKSPATFASPAGIE
jgi:YHS domain-containing protein